MEYVVITTAYNEEELIEKTIKSLIKQTKKPLQYVIVNDGSTDRTEEIVKHYSKKYAWIQLISVDKKSEHDFSSKVKAFNEGYNRLKNMDYDAICNMDADVTFDNDYMEFLVDKLNHDPKLGVVGTPFIENDSVSSVHKYGNNSHVSGGIQFFRKQCFLEIGGFIPLKRGDEDWTAVTTARMIGWKTKTFSEKAYSHNRKLGSRESNNPIIIKYRYGKRDSLKGNHILWEFFRFLFNIFKKPYIIGASAMLLGYIVQSFSFEIKEIDPKLKKFVQKEQMNRLKEYLIVKKS